MVLRDLAEENIWSKEATVASPVINVLKIVRTTLRIFSRTLAKLILHLRICGSSSLVQ